MESKSRKWYSRIMMAAESDSEDEIQYEVSTPATNKGVVVKDLRVSLTRLNVDAAKKVNKRQQNIMHTFTNVTFFNLIETKDLRKSFDHGSRCFECRNFCRGFGQ